MNDGLIRGAQAIADYLNRRLAGGRRLNKKAVYHMVETGRLPVSRLDGGREIWARQADLDKFPEAVE